MLGKDRGLHVLGMGMVCAKTQSGQVPGAEVRGSDILNKGTTRKSGEKGEGASQRRLSGPS